MAQCNNCGMAPARTKSRCDACYNYRKRTGVERPPELHKARTYREKASSKWCKVCGSLEIVAASRCDACCHYYRRHKKERPRHLWDVDVKCKTCRIPLKTLGRRKNGTPRYVGGYCENCYNYRRHHGLSRPRSLWGAGAYGFCECGYPAVAIIDKDIPVCVRHKE